jgi:hypothetical protein
LIFVFSCKVDLGQAAVSVAPCVVALSGALGEPALPGAPPKGAAPKAMLV